MTNELRMALSPIRQSEDVGGLMVALAAAQIEFPAIPKVHTAKIKAGFSYSYADLADVVSAIRPILAKHGIATMQLPLLDGTTMKLVTRLAWKNQ